MKKNLFKLCLALGGVLGVEVSSAADFLRARSFVQEAVSEAQGIYQNGGYGHFYVAESNLRELPFLLNDLPLTPALDRINQLSDSAVRSLMGYGTLLDKARVVLNNGREMLRLIDVLERNHPGRPIRGEGILEVPQMIDQSERMVLNRNYDRALRQLRQIDDVISRYALDHSLRQAQDALVTVARTISDPYSSEALKQRVARDHLRFARNQVMNSDAYRRSIGGYDPPTPPRYPPNPPGRLISQRLVCESSGEFRECFLGARVVQASLLFQRGAAHCVEGRTWGFTSEHVWVDRGCRAEFDVLIEANY